MQKAEASKINVVKAAEAESEAKFLQGQVDFHILKFSNFQPKPASSGNCRILGSKGSTCSHSGSVSMPGVIETPKRIEALPDTAVHRRVSRASGRRS